jgi:hypothetical protein
MSDGSLSTQLKYRCQCGNTIFELKGDAKVHVIAISGSIETVCGRCGAKREVMKGAGVLRVEKNGEVSVTT